MIASYTSIVFITIFIKNIWKRVFLYQNIYLRYHHSDKRYEKKWENKEKIHTTAKIPLLSCYHVSDDKYPYHQLMDSLKGLLALFCFLRSIRIN